MSRILDGAELAGFIKERQAKQVRALRQAWQIFPKLAIVTNSDDPVSGVYIRLKQAYGADILIDVELFRVETSDLVATIRELNNRHDVQGVIMQLPLKDEVDVDEVLSQIAPEKDVDGLGAEATLDAATPTAINWLLAGYGVELRGKKIALVGRGRLVGAPLEKIWRASGLDVSVFEEGDDLAELNQFEVIVSAAGAPGVVKPGMVALGATVVDAGAASEGGKIIGDVDPETRLRSDVTITPEKGGVGPLTVAALFDNLITACNRLVAENKRD